MSQRGNNRDNGEKDAPSLDQAAAKAANKHSTSAESALGFMATEVRLVETKQALSAVEWRVGVREALQQCNCTLYSAGS